jgi:Flp pilus assembly protein TadG
MSKRSLIGDKRGAVLAEFVIAIVPVFMTFFSFVQLSKIATARLVVKHGTIIGARAASVISNANDNTPDAKGDGQAEITQAVRAGMGPWIANGSITNVNVTVADQSSRSDPYGWVTVTVRAEYRCRVPMGFFACGGLSKTLEESYRMPHQGAIYKM